MKQPKDTPSRPRRGCRLLLAGLLALVLLCACTSLLAYKAFGPTAACKNPATGPARPGASARTLLSGGRERCYLLYVPPDYDPARPLPLVVSFHGFASSARAQETVAQWNRLADREGFVVVYPEGTAFPLRWNASPEFLAGSVDDVQFFRDLLADVAANVAVDPARFYVSGMSNGGAMTNRIACEAADLVAAASTVAAVPFENPAGCTPAHPVPFIAFHGTADPLVPYEGGSYQLHGLRRLLNVSTDTVTSPSIESWIAGWAERNGCALPPQALPAHGDASGIRYTGCRDGAEVILYTIDGGGHTWPGSGPIPFMGKTSQDIDASETLWLFFKAFQLEEGNE
jgi:polyhydroxybutyrate depolymerase